MVKVAVFVIRLFKTMLIMTVGALSIAVLINQSPPAYMMRVLLGSIGLLFLVHHEHLIGLNFVNTLRKDLKLVEVQNAILNEVKNNNTKVMELMASQADALSKMTKIAIKKNSEELNVRS